MEIIMDNELILELQTIIWKSGELTGNEDLIDVMSRLKDGSIGKDHHRLADYSIQFNDICDQLKQGGI